MFEQSKFERLINSLDVENLKVCQQLIGKVLDSKLPPAPVGGSGQDIDPVQLSSKSAAPVDINELIEYHKLFISETERRLLEAELESLHFKQKSQSDAVQNRFLSSGSDPYSWKSKKGVVINLPEDLSNYPVLKSIMDRINSMFLCKMNSVLVSFFKNGAVNIRLHDDHEPTLDPSQPICVLSVGVKRRVEFVAKDKEFKYAADLVLEPEDSSLYIMKPGCQKDYLHRVRADKSIKEPRFSMSFRCFIGPNQDKSVSFSTPPAPSAQIPGKITAQPVVQSSAIPSSSPLTLDSTVQGFSPFPGHSSITSHSVTQQQEGEKYCLLLGSSITKGVDESRMKRGSRSVINLSESGAKIRDIHRISNNFYADNPGLAHKVYKIIVNIGTNEVKWLNGRKCSVSRKFRTPLCNFIRDLKCMFPFASIVFTTVLPIKAFYVYTAETVHAFNRLIFEVCRDLGCMFFDCFYDFLAPDYHDYNVELFRDKWHLNEIGLRLFCRTLKYIAFSNNLYCSHPRTRCCPPYYDF